MKRWLALGMMAVMLGIGQQGLAAGEVVVYTARKEQLIKPVFDAFTAESGIAVKYVTGDAGPLLERLKAEGANTEADMLMTVDAGNLWQAARDGVLNPVKSAVLEGSVPANLRDPDNLWFGLTVRARTMVYSTERVKPGELDTYAGLADAKWKGRLCLRTSKKVYNQSLVGMMLARIGAEKTMAVVKGWVANLAEPEQSSDAKVMEAIVAGRCDVGLVNTYYYGELMREKPDTKLALFWPDQNGNGVHVNVSGAGVTKHAKHGAEAVKLLEWMIQPKAQGMFAELNLEYPVNPAVPPSALVAGWGKFKQDDANVSLAGKFQTEAVMLMDQAGYK